MIGDNLRRLRGAFAVLGLLAATLLASPLPAQATDDKSMTFTLGRLEGSPDCGVPCAQFIVAEGHIEQFSSFSYLIARKRSGDRNLPVLLSSPGGYVYGADRIARVWRKLGVTAIVAEAKVVCGGLSALRKLAGGPCHQGGKAPVVQVFRMAHGEAKCASACTLAVAGATRRMAAEGARIGLHRTYVDPGTEVAQLAERLGASNEDVVEQVEKTFREALSQLGIDPELAHRAARTPASSMEWITPEEARRYKLFNAQADDASLPEGLRVALANR
ncbi:MAG: hypothetical protein ACRDBH_09695 [Bosea sp. (in: a-proteobacteria)]